MKQAKSDKLTIQIQIRESKFVELNLSDLSVSPDDPIISSVLVCSFVRQLNIFLRIDLVFSDFWHEVRGLQKLNSDWGQFLWKIHFSPNLGKKTPQKRLFYIFFFLILLFSFPKSNAEWNFF